VKILLHYLRPYRGLIAFTLLLATVNTVFSLFDPILFGKIIRVGEDLMRDREAGKETSWGIYFERVIYILLLSMGTAMLSRIAKNFQDYFANVVMQKFGARVFTEGLQHAMKLPYQEFEDQRSGETLSILTKVRVDTEKFIQYFLNALFAILVGIVFVFTYAAIYIHWSVMVAYIGGILVLASLTNILSRKVKEIQKKIVSSTTSLAGSTTESLRNIELVKSLGLTTQEVKRLNANTYRILGLELTKVKRIRSISFLQGTLVNTLRQVILFLLMWLIFRDKMKPHEMVTMQFFSFFIFGPLQEIGNILLSYREAEASLQNYDALMRKEPEGTPMNPMHMGPVERLEFQQVSFQHRTTSQPAIDGIDFCVTTGETIAFVGPSGSGKTTLMKLLVGLYRPDKGAIRYNGIEESHIDFEDLRSQIGFVTQDTQLFSGTIRENLLFVRPEAEETDVLDCLQKAACQNLLERADQGLDTLIGEGGLKLSGGERQRLSIARALLRKPRILLFDEATSALDSITEEDITTTIRDISASREQITILIAHRLSTIMHADRILVLERGQVVEDGTHEHLLEEKGLYYAMWRQQIGERRRSMT